MRTSLRTARTFAQVPSVVTVEMLASKEGYPLWYPWKPSANDTDRHRRCPIFWAVRPLVFAPTHLMKRRYGDALLVSNDDFNSMG